jgi:cytidylate kinase
MAVITISRQFGIGGIELTRRISQMLDFSFYAKEIAAAVAKKLGLDHQVVLDYQEKLEHRTNWMMSSFAGHFALSSKNYIKEAEYQKVVTEIVQNLAQQDNVVILGCGGQCILRNFPNTFHFRIVADLAARVAHIRLHYRNLEDIPPLKMLEHRIHHMDGLRKRFIHTNFGANVDEPTLYHAILNLSRLGRDRVCEIMIEIIEGTNVSHSDRSNHLIFQ